MNPVERLWRPPALPGARSYSGCPGGIEPAAKAFTGPQGRMQNHYTTDTISSPGWIRTSDLSHVTGMSCLLNDGTVIPRPGFEPGTPRSKRGMMVHFTIGASSGRQGSRTLISVGRTAFPERPGQPYPATFRQWTARESHPHLRRAGPASSCWTSSPINDPGWTRTIVTWV